jgi:hypothetical protein
MTQQHTPIRSSLTAVAAVLALSSTAAFAQSADQAAPDQSAPAIAAPPPPVVSAAPATDASAPAEPTTSLTSAPVEPSTPAPVATMATRSTPVIHTPDADASARTSAPVMDKAAASTATNHVTTTTRSTVSTSKTTSPAPAPVVRKAAPEPAPAPATTVVPATPPAAATTATTRTSVQSENDQMLEVGGAIGLGVIALGAGALLLGRRRRREEDEEELILPTEPTERTILTPVYTPEQAAATETVTATPVLARTEDGEEQMVLDNGFDLSRFGRHVRAAYRGPTPDNPSHSLHKRLARARFFDLRERQAIERGEIVPEAQAIAARTTAPAAAKDDDQIVVRPGWRKPSRFFGTAFQR